jgi:Na+-transporting methylmalonyl-CoA/oxaloacetate decarboxylase gamma subunit
MNNMLLALQITALGMGLVFAAIVLLWWLMNLLTFITAEKEAATSPGASVSDPAEAAALMNCDLKAQAAAVAVALALTEQQVSTARPLTEPPTTIVSAWQLGMRTRQMYQKGVSVRRRVMRQDIK